MCHCDKTQSIRNVCIYLQRPIIQYFNSEDTMKKMMLFEEDCLYDHDFFIKLIDTLWSARSKYVKENTVN